MSTGRGAVRIERIVSQDDYAGVRIARTGQRFLIQRATVWNLTDDQGRLGGQAATFREWRYVEDAGSERRR